MINSRFKRLFQSHEDLSITGESLQNLSLSSVFTAYDQGNR